MSVINIDHNNTKLILEVVLKSLSKAKACNKENVFTRTFWHQPLSLMYNALKMIQLLLLLEMKSYVHKEKNFIKID